MELRKTEEEVNAIGAAYEHLRQTKLTSPIGGDESSIDPLYIDLSSLPPLAELRRRIRANNGTEGGNSDGEVGVKASFNPNSFVDGEMKREGYVKNSLSELVSIRDRVEALHQKADRFRKRLEEKDPITNAPRYGEKTTVRVATMLEFYDALNMGIGIAFGDIGIEEVGRSKGEGIVDAMRRFLEEEEEALQRAKNESAAAAAQEAARKEAEARQFEEMKRREGKDALEAKRREEEELHQLALEARREREQREALEAQAAREADHAFIASIRKGPDGVREQLSALREGTASEPEAHRVAIDSLHTIFTQIVAHPEDVKFRRIRRDHQKFNEDIGRHQGGKEILIAAGFSLESVDGVACFFSKEPDIENDMDSWSDWFSGLKSTLEIIEDEMLK